MPRKILSGGSSRYGLAPALAQAFHTDFTDSTEISRNARIVVTLNDISGAIIGSALQIHRDVGSGLFESVYEVLLSDALRRKGLHVENQLEVPVIIGGRHFDKGFRLDILVERTVVVEVKSKPALVPAFSKQVLTYARLLNIPLGLLLNFGTEHLEIKRIINGYDHSVRSP